MLSKRVSGHLGNIVFAIAVTAALPTSAAHAYLDPGSVSMALQVVIGGVASALMFGKLYLRRVLSFFRRGDDAAGNSAND